MFQKHSGKYFQSSRSEIPPFPSPSGRGPTGPFICPLRGARGVRVITVLLCVCAGHACCAEKELALELGGDVKLELLLIPPGTFKQGSHPTEAGRSDDET